MNLEQIKVIAFDADDTLWQNQNFFEEANSRFQMLISPYEPNGEKASQLLLETENRNVAIYGYGAKSFMLSMVETALQISNYQIDQYSISEMLRVGKSILNMPIILLEGVKDVVEQVATSQRYQLVVATKGDLTNQKQKLEQSGLEHLFHHAEIMSDKQPKDYEVLLDRLGCQPHELLMVGNSLKSDIIPILELGGYAMHIPYHLTWANEVVDGGYTHPHMLELSDIKELLTHLHLA